MNRKFFYTFLAIVILAFLIYTLLGISVFKYMGIKTYSLGKIKDLCAVLIIIYESISAKKSIQKITLSLMAVSILAYFMRIMSWPFAELLLYGSLLANCVLLFINAVKSNNPFIKALILIYPISRLLLTESYFHSSTAWWTLEIFIPAAFAAFLLLARKKV